VSVEVWKSTQIVETKQLERRAMEVRWVERLTRVQGTGSPVAGWSEDAHSVRGRTWMVQGQVLCLLKHEQQMSKVLLGA